RVLLRRSARAALRRRRRLRVRARPRCRWPARIRPRQGHHPPPVPARGAGAHLRPPVLGGPAAAAACPDSLWVLLGPSTSLSGRREMTQIKTVGVVGMGTMGAGIAEVLARNGLEVMAAELDEQGVARGRGHLEHSTGRALERGKLVETARRELLGRITFTTTLAELANVDLVIEAVPERLDLKAQIFTELDGLVRGEVVLASNTSSLSITQLAARTKRPDKVVGLHFFNPAPVLKLVEVVRTVVTDPKVIENVTALAESLGKTPVVVGDRAGFIANGLLFGYLNHAARMFEERYATREDLDAAMRFGCGYPMGPLALLDLIGLDTAYEILDALYRQSRDRLHAPTPRLKQMITAGLLGRKSGRGFYTYAEPDSSKIVPDAATPRPGEPGTETRPITTVGVVGTGTMATGIVEVVAKSGRQVIVRGRSS